MNWRVWVGILLMPLAAAGIWYVLSHEQNVPNPILFTAEGNLIRNNPGFELNTWYLSYDEGGAPGLSVALYFDSTSRCGPEGMLDVCDISFEQGQRVRVEGTRKENSVHVETLFYLPEPREDGTNIKLYYYNPSLDQGPGSVQCTEKGLVAVERVIPKTTTPLTEAVRLLLRGELAEEERTQGITTEFPLEGVSLQSATIENGIATLIFTDPHNKTGGGACRVSILRYQIEATAKQFSTVRSVRFAPDELFQP